jgi:hypothetical protein
MPRPRRQLAGEAAFLYCLLLLEAGKDESVVFWGQ